ncbi:MAG: type II toxin-antitoxin system RelB/DinJ family antitoxin [Bacteroides sp.]|nr:type II toxin-antitoxin system RelB/DinJ family antitoxin [Bacillota bacterium]MCM1393335.1 type II toxin-antitoxin system RelB/DinJ family antitoxin [[Eubacterium] siraeum]MCM1455429.1 type II toxin-antitoxin system RelB/DinJ family antitoxin [Bacteroides sp.]
MAKVSTNITIDADVKKQAQALFADLGMDLSTAINVYLKKAVAEQGIPFEVTREVPNRVTARAIADAEKSKDVYGPFDSVDELMEALNA